MRVITLSIFWTIAVDIIAWAFFHMSISYFMLKIPSSFFEKDFSWLGPQSWEQNGKIWQDLFHIQSWKQHLPDGTFLLKTGYDKSSLKGTDTETLYQFILETKRGEMTHWLSILPAGLFFLWNPPWAGWLMVVYAIVFNLPFIISQRYNRPRLQRLYKKTKRRI